VALIDGCNTRDRACLVVQNFVGDVWGYAEPRHARDASSSQIMKPPSGDAGNLVYFSLGGTEVLK
jgi:hypothetical protein